MRRKVLSTHKAKEHHLAKGGRGGGAGTGVGGKKKERKKVTSIALRQLNQRGLNNKLKTTQSVFNISSFIQVVGVLP